MRDAKVGSIIATLFGGCFLIAICFVVIFYPPQFFGMDLFTPSSGNNIASDQTIEPEPVVESSIEESVEEENAIDIEEIDFVSIEEAITDLEKSGCVITEVDDLSGYPDSRIFLEYDEFKKIAVKEEIVFLLTVEEHSVLFIPYENSHITWFPDEPADEESDKTPAERLVIQTGYGTYDSESTSWLITLKVKNEGNSDVVIKSAFLNDIPCEILKYGIDSVPIDNWGTSFPSTGIPLESGKTVNVYYYIDVGYASFTSGTTINTKLTSERGTVIIKLIRLP
ncbi:MAG: hypothetical protein NWE89_04305 [Candidatus Bathyarchaeota archaeon]|nr:hypothetical protein [Candidatus Bathyarchaeota archaeon]